MNLDLSVDRHNLDAALEQIPNEIKTWGQSVVEAQLDLMIAEQKLDLIQAQQSIAIRNSPSEYGISKVTEDLIKSTVTVQPAYQAALTDYTAKKNAVNSAKAILDALEVRRSSLKHLAELTISGFLGSTQVNPMPAGIKQRS
jgi:hypothetical protein